MNDQGSGFIYINQNCLRAMDHLIAGSGPEWRERIRNAVLDAHRPSDTEFYTQWMSPKTLDAWRNSSPDKSFDELTDEEVADVARNLIRFILTYQWDCALRGAEQGTKPTKNASASETPNGDSL